MADEHVFLIKPSIFHKSKLLTIAPSYISYGESNSETEKVYYTREELDAYRFGGFYGKDLLNMRYSVQLRTLENKVIKITEYRFLCIGRKKFFQKYHAILDLVYQYYFLNIVNSYIELFNNNIDFELEGTIFSRNGVQFKKDSPLINWGELDSSNYKTYYALVSKKDNNNYKAFSYLEDWNTIIVLAVTRAIIHFINNQQLERNN